MQRYVLATDGGASPNPGPGGWGAVVVAPDGSRRELSGAAAHTTNNRMELTAALEGLRALPEDAELELLTDSLYLKKGVTEWLTGWRRRGWKTAAGDDVANRDLWEALAAELERRRVQWRWVRGHAGDDLNEAAHHLAAAAIARPELPLGDADAVHLFVAVAYSGKGKVGAWGAVLCHRDRQRELAGRLPGISPNALHIASAVGGLDALRRPVRVHLYTASDYLANGATKWLPGWKRRGWRTAAGEPVSNREHWERLERAVNGHEVRWHVLDRDADLPELEAARTLARARLGAPG